VARTTTKGCRQAAAAGLVLSEQVLDELAARRVPAGRGPAADGLRGLVPEITRRLMQAALEAEMDLHLAEKAGRTGGRGSRSGGNAHNGYRAKNPPQR
jgi:putative transposase